MEQELKRKTLMATAGGVMKAVQLDALAPAMADLTFRTDDPFVVDLTITTFLETPRGSHAESANWLVGRELFTEGFTHPGRPAGEGDVAFCYDAGRDQMTMVFTDSSEHNPGGLQATHRMVVDAEPIRTLIHHAHLLVPSPQLDVDAFLTDVLGD